MKIKSLLLMITVFALVFAGCNGQKATQQSSDESAVSGSVLIYTSMYEDIIDNVKKEISVKFPQVEIEFFQGGTGTLQSKIAAERASGKLGCDMLMVAEPSYSLELKELGLLHPYLSKNAQNVALPYDEEGYWYPVRMLNMILAYNPEKTAKENVARTFKEFAEKETLKGRISMPDPLKSGTALAAVSAFYDAYGETFFQHLQEQQIAVESGSAAVSKLESGEYDQIMILEESILKKREEEQSTLEVIYPDDGTIAIPSTIMTIKGEQSAHNNVKACEAITDWFLSPEGQKAIVDGWMHSVLKNPEKYPFDARSTSEILLNTLPIDWVKSYKNRDELRRMFENYIVRAAK